MTSLKRLLTLICLAAACLSTQIAMASHPFHVSSAEVEYNQNRETFEVAICLWPEDLAKAVSQMEQKPIDIDAISETERDKLFKKYVSQKFRFINSSTAEDEEQQPATIRWVGSELNLKQGWLYFEVDAKSAGTEWTIENKMFFEVNEDQLNQVQIRHRKALMSQTLSTNQPAVEWSAKLTPSLRDSQMR